MSATTTQPTFVRGDTPYWEYPCGCRASALQLEHCPTHAAAPEMRALLAEMLDAQVCGPCALCDKARALLARIDGAA